MAVAAAALLAGCVPGPEALWAPAQKGHGDVFVAPGEWVDVPAGSCNDSSMAQVPGHPDLFIGRITQAQLDGGTCDQSSPGATWSLVTYHFDWTTHRITQGNQVIPTNAVVHASTVLFGGYLPIDEVTLLGELDPSVASFNGELWVAFECGFKAYFTGVLPPNPYNSTCIGPLSISGSNATIDTTRTVVAVVGVSQPDTSPDRDWYSASFPKLLSTNGHLYVYWSQNRAVARSRLEPGDEDPGWGDPVLQGARSYGMELEQETGTQHRLWVKGSGAQPIRSNDSRAVEVWTRDLADVNSNVVADVNDVHQFGNEIYVVTALGGNGCPAPTLSVPGCYRIALSRTTSPLSTNGFQSDRLPDTDLPQYLMDYPRFVVDPAGHPFVLTHVRDVDGVAGGERLFPLTPDDDMTAVMTVLIS